MSFKLSDLVEATNAYLTDIFHLRTTDGIDKKITGENLISALSTFVLGISSTTTVDLSQYTANLVIMLDTTTDGEVLTLSNSLNDGFACKVINTSTGVWSISADASVTIANVKEGREVNFVSVSSAMVAQQSIMRSLSIQSSENNCLQLLTSSTNNVALALGTQSAVRYRWMYKTSEESLVLQAFDATGTLIQTALTLTSDTEFSMDTDMSLNGDFKGSCDRIYIEDEHHCISASDGGGGFNIRVGNTPSGDPTFTEAGYASHLAFYQGIGRWFFAVSDASGTIGDDVSFDTLVGFDRDSFDLFVPFHPTTTVTTGTLTCAGDSGSLIPIGIITLTGLSSSNYSVQYYIDGAWQTAWAGGNTIDTTQVISDGVTCRVYNDASASITLDYIKH